MTDRRARDETRWAWATAAFFGVLTVYVPIALGTDLRSLIATVSGGAASLAWVVRAVQSQRR